MENFHAEFLDLPSTAAGGPEQFWLSLGSDPASMTITWLTANSDASTVKFGVNGQLTNTVTGTASTYTIGSYTSGYIHIATMTGLTAGADYSYQVGGASTSAVMTFTAPRGVGAVYPFKLGAIGDLGQTAYSNSTVFHTLSGSPDVAFITGDLSCASKYCRHSPARVSALTAPCSNYPPAHCAFFASQTQTVTSRCGIPSAVSSPLSRPPSLSWSAPVTTRSRVGRSSLHTIVVTQGCRRRWARRGPRSGTRGRAAPCT